MNAFPTLYLQIVFIVALFLMLIGNLHRPGVWLAFGFGLVAVSAPFALFSIGCIRIVQSKFKSATLYLDAAYPVFHLLSPLSNMFAVKAAEAAYWACFCDFIEGRNNDLKVSMPRAIKSLAYLDDSFEERRIWEFIAESAIQQAFRYFINGRPEVSERCIQKSLEALAKLIPAPPKLLAKAHCVVGKFLATKGLNEQAEYHLAKGLKVFQAIPDISVEDRATGFLYLGKIFLRRGDRTAAREKIDAAVCLLEKSQSVNYYDALFFKARLLQQMCDGITFEEVDTALPIYAEPIAAPAPGGNWCLNPMVVAVGLTTILPLISIYFAVVFNRLRTAELLAKQVQRNLRDNETEFSLQPTGVTLTNILMNMGEFSKARREIENSIQAMAMARFEHKYELVKALCLICKTYAYEGNYKKMLFFSRTASASLKNMPSSTVGEGVRHLEILYLLGTSHQICGDRDGAARFYRTANAAVSSALEQSQCREIESWASTIAIALGLVSEPESALSHIEAVRKLRVKGGPLAFLSNQSVLQEICCAQAYLGQNNLASAELCLSRARRMLGRSPWLENEHRIRVVHLQGKLQSAKSDLPSAEKHLHKAVTMMREWVGNEHPLTASIERDYSELLEAAGKLTQSEEMDSHARRILEKRDEEFISTAPHAVEMAQA